ncbi:hypothetical protein XaC1_196 [Xanthomonas phage XaC1]|nr:hypothetical protein XaC1_196 [Xanthomonas phage XaC1]
MKKALIALTLLLVGCKMDGTYREEYLPVYLETGTECAQMEPTVYLINGIPNFKYICYR